MIIGAYAKNSKVPDGSSKLSCPRGPRSTPHLPDVEWVFTMTRGIPYKSVRGFNDALEGGPEGPDPAHVAAHLRESLNGERSRPDYGNETGRLVID